MKEVKLLELLFKQAKDDKLSVKNINFLAKNWFFLTGDSLLSVTYFIFISQLLGYEFYHRQDKSQNNQAKIDNLTRTELMLYKMACENYLSKKSETYAWKHAIAEAHNFNLTDVEKIFEKKQQQKEEYNDNPFKNKHDFDIDMDDLAF